MECKEFMGLLDAFIDNELDQIQRKRMLDHADRCETCALELKHARALSAMLAELDADPVVPLAAQAAWRRAVKNESHKRRFNGFYRAASAVAAAFVLMIGSTFALRETGVIDRASAPAAVSAWQEEDVAYSGPARQRSLAESATAIEADGDTSEAPVAKSSGMIEGDNTLSAAEKTAEESEELFARSAMRDIYSEDFASARAQIGDLVSEYGGRLTSDSTFMEDGVQTAQIQAAIPSKDLDAFLTAIDYVGVVASGEVFTEDLTLDYFDAQGRLETFAAERDRLNELISSAADSEELAALNAQLEDVYARIDEIESSLRAFDDRINYAQVLVTLREGAAPATTATSEPTLTGRMKNGFSATVSGMKDFFSDMAVSLAIIAPVAAIAIPLIAVIWIAVVLVKRRRRR